MAEPDSHRPRAFVIGHPIGHSRSPLIHGYWLRQAGIEGSYEAIDVAPDDLPAFISALRDGSSGFCGGNVTIPHKEAVLDLVDDVDETARRIGAANTLWCEDGRVKAGNTDSYGFTANLDVQAPGWDRGKSAVILGAGGASRAVIHALLARGLETIQVVNRTEARARILAEVFGPRVTAHRSEQLSNCIQGADLFVNTTSLGMGGSEIPDIDFTVMADNALVTDIVYIPLETPMLALARQHGLRTVDGLGMLLHQAVPGFARWFGLTPEVSPELRQMIVADMESHS
ncbi:shikimate dehydrogenase [Hoeflea halophila]|uniref:Shikimate dehydrogenase (NADP(+)) n=1 Tax=Hoeflea halophila TaxID=714899 RepID=A0A286IC59_9HYPH|nr:shikimate dehydrogenase [Hoeflea halophila]SOE16959.1 shikimate dehydrogenase [Hoeflea halophila]